MRCPCLGETSRGSEFRGGHFSPRYEAPIWPAGPQVFPFSAPAAPTGQTPSLTSLAGPPAETWVSADWRWI